MKAIIAVPATLALVYRAHSHKSLTPAGLVAAALTATAHAVHPWNLPFVLLAVFFLAGTRVTKIKKQVKAHLTVQAGGPSGDGEGPRTHVQVIANSGVASLLALLHAYQLHQRKAAVVDLYNPQRTAPTVDTGLGALCYAWRGDLLVVGIMANYACVAADTFSSELGILSTAAPRLITSRTLRRVPRGTNGGVTLFGLGAGLLGSVIVVTAAMLFLPLCGPHTNPVLLGGAAASPALAASAVWSLAERRLLMAGLAVWGLLGSILDSVLGGLFQRSVRDVHSGKIVEGEGGVRVAVTEDPHTRVPADPAPPHADAAADAVKPSRVAENGWDLLDNNDVNFLMAFSMSVGAMLVASWYWDVPMDSILKP